VGPEPIQCLTSQAVSRWGLRSPDAPRHAAAVPPYISGRTSYLRVRWEFLLYPQVIPPFCNTGGFGPRRGLTPASPCPWVAHSVSGRIPATLSYAPSHTVLRPLQTRFRYGSTARCVSQGAALTASPPFAREKDAWHALPLNLLAHRTPLPFRGGGAEQDAPTPPTSTRRIILQKARRQTRDACADLSPGRRYSASARPPTACRYRVSGSLSFPSRGAFHLSLTVLVPYRWPRVCSPWRVVPPASHRMSRVPWYSGFQPGASRPSPTGLSPSVVEHPSSFG
jgi:hypothetical protein